MKTVNSFKPLITFTKKLHLRCLTRSWICLCRGSHLKGILENSCSEICSQNSWKIPMKKFIFSKTEHWQSATFSCIPLRFLPNKEIPKIAFFTYFFLRSKLPGTWLFNFTKNKLFLLKTNIFQGFWLKNSPGKFQNNCL